MKTDPLNPLYSLPADSVIRNYRITALQRAQSREISGLNAYES